MSEEHSFKVGDKVKHRFRDSKYQCCTVVKVESGCNGRVIVICGDGFYGSKEESAFCPQDLVVVK